MMVENGSKRQYFDREKKNLLHIGVVTTISNGAKNSLELVVDKLDSILK